MEFVVKVGNPEKQRSACVVVGVFESRRFSAAAAALNEASQAHLAKILRLGDMDGKPGSRLMLHKVNGLACERVLLIGLGKDTELSDKTYREAVRLAVRETAALKLDEVACYLPEVSVKGRDAAWNAEQLVLVGEESLYRSDRLKSKKDEAGSLKKITLGCLDRATAGALQAGVKRGVAVAAGMNLSKDLGNLPGNICTPSYLADQAKALAKNHGFKVEVMGEDKIRKLGMGSFLSVAKGSDEPPRFIVLEHRGGKKNDKPVVLVGKGITFDSGGISLKPGAEMDEMKYDMCGAASVLGTFRALADLELPLNVVGLIPTCENLPSGRANKPGDIVTAMSGLTIEVLNTDAEGRLILCDALTYAERFKPACVVDIATLTGACVIALGHVASGLLANDDALAGELTAAGEGSGDRCWRLPLWDEYQEQLKSNFADLANIGGRAGGTITAACFLSRFTENYTWAHLDIAGTAWKSGKEKGGTGRPVPLLVHFLANRVK